MSWFTSSDPAPMIGYVCVVSKQHVVEPYDLDSPIRGAFWEDTLRAAEVVSRLFRPMKMNYEIHGNTIPHLHTHIFPRYPDDPFVGGPIDVRHASVNWPPDALAGLRAALAG